MPPPKISMAHRENVAKHCVLRHLQVFKWLGTLLLNSWGEIQKISKCFLKVIYKMECDICDTNHFLKQNKTNRKHGLIKRCERSEILSNFQTMWINGKGIWYETFLRFFQTLCMCWGKCIHCIMRPFLHSSKGNAWMMHCLDFDHGSDLIISLDTF